MSAMRTASAWHPWRMRRGNNLPQVFRWVDDSGPVDLTGMDLRLRITLFDGTVIDKRAGVDSEFLLLDQADPLSRGMFSFQPALALTRLLPSAPAARYEFEVRYEGLEQSIGAGQIALDAGDNADG